MRNAIGMKDSGWSVVMIMFVMTSFLEIFTFTHGFTIRTSIKITRPLGFPRSHNSMPFCRSVQRVPSSSSTSLFVGGNVDIGGNEADDGVEEASLIGLGEDHEIVGEDMAKSVAAWLDAEWMPQEVHIRMGLSVQQTYITCRTSGVDDVGAIMTQVTDDLYENWSDYDKDAFVNAWDVGNYVADYLIAKSGSETCGCSAQIH